MRLKALVLLMSLLVLSADAAGAAPSFMCKGKLATIVGTPGNDTIRGTADSDVIVGRAGNDEIKGKLKSDLICGNRGDDTIYGNGVRDRGTNNISGEPQLLSGGPGNDVLYSGAYAGLYGDKGDDVLVIDGRFAAAYGGAGNDRLDSSEGRGGYLLGGPGDDLIHGGERGEDTALFRGADGPITADLGSQTVSGQGNDTISGIEHLEGGDFDDVMIGDEGPNSLRGGGGNDRLDGRDGDDSLYGDEYGKTKGSDELLGGAGDDFFMPDITTGMDDTVDGGDGIDRLEMFLSPSTVDLSEGTSSGDMGNDTIANIENVAGGGYEDTIIGNDGPNELIGNGGRDLIDGRGGDDILTGEAGPHERWFTQKDEDTILGGDGNDTITSEQGNDEIDGGPGNDTIDSGRNNDSVVGGPGDDSIVGNFGNDDLDGSEGTDRLDGGGGTDACRNGEEIVNCEP